MRSRIENNNVTFCLFFLELYFGESAHSHTTLRTDSVSAAGCWQHSPLVAVSALFPMGSSRSRANPQSPSSFNNHHQRPSSVRTGFPRPASRVSLRCLAPACAECSRRDATRCAFPCGQHAAVRARRLPHVRGSIYRCTQWPHGRHRRLSSSAQAFARRPCLRRRCARASRLATSGSSGHRHLQRCTATAIRPSAHRRDVRVSRVRVSRA